MKKSLYIYGASGHAKVVIDIAEKMGGWEIRGVLDDNAALVGRQILGHTISGGLRHVDFLDSENDFIFVAIGANATRRHIAGELAAKGFRFPVVIHPSATIARDVVIGDGTVIMAGAVVNPATTIGRLCILNTCSSVDHDNNLGEAVHISPGAHLAGNVKVGDESWVGIGSNVIEGCVIGSRCIIGGGAAVIGNLPSDVTAVGVPARVIARSNPSQVLSETR